MAVCKLRLRLFPSWPLYSSCRLMGTAGGDGEPTKFQPPPKPVIVDKTSQATQRKFLSPEFIPPRGRTDPLKYSIERKDMVARRKLLTIPEFYVGSILAVTMSDINANDKVNRFVGICTQRSGSGLGATFVLRNIIEGQGVEIRYDLYSPRIQEIQVLKLEKRLDDNLMYLRDALPEYSTFDFDMKVVPHSINEEVPVNQLKVRMKPKPWSKRWERPQFKVQGIRFDLCLKEEQLKEAKKWDKPWLEFDMLKEYDTTKIEETIWKEINPQPN
ncbi:39S ribosomal protein L19, mitochondrial isoform X1 [Rhinatrema bivittatum]|uniref:39S ribosomal protein L19, mitochondrial isoform X1 n=1 Tax=Rhinatrema bivittatum TaxID=194408 RepID=UPI00112DCB85|nr:39S ribosomal protein L19, mitochondrial isoform X1 [Rhinatrema bivittatum]